MRLPVAERIAADGVTPALLKRLNFLVGARGELSSLAARTAADAELERVYGAGDHSSDVARPADAAFEAAVAASPGQKALFNHDTPAFHAIPADRVKLATEPEVMQRFRWANSDRFARLDADALWFSQLRSATMSQAGRQSVAAWRRRTCTWRP